MARITGLLIVTLLVALLILSSCADGLSRHDDPEELDLVKEVWNIVLEDHVNSASIDKQKLAEAAIRGMLDSLDDPYTSYLTPEEAQIAEGDLEGDFSGIGATIGIQDEVLTVVAPIPDSPAEQAGIKPGDRILEVDGRPTSEMTLTEATLNIRGKEGTKVKLLIQHQGEDTPVEIEVMRAKIEPPSVRWEIVGEGIAHIGISSFSDRTESELKSSIEELLPKGIEGIVLDLRNNPGGVVTGAVGVTSQFVNRDVIVYALDNRGKKTEWSAKSGGLALEIPLVVLVNGYSASASEIVAGALQDYGRAMIVGTTTFGKGSMQEVIGLSNEGSLHVTFAHWFTPNGHQIQGEGIVPDIEVEITPEDIASDRDPQLEQAIDSIVKKPQ